MSSVSILHAPDKPQITRRIEAVYNPLTDRRPCGHCGSRTDWQRLEWGDNPGGWFCTCSPLPEISTVPGEMKHTCTVACALAGVA